MSNEHLGIVEERLANRLRYARYAYRAPVAGAGVSHYITVNIPAGERTVETIAPPPLEEPPKPIVIPKLPETIEELRARVAKLYHELEVRKREVASLESQVAPGDNITIKEVQEAFLAELHEVGYTVGRHPYEMHHLLAERRDKVVSQPRMVCIALAQRICGVTLNVLGRAFRERGTRKMDHSSIMNAVRRSSEVMHQTPALAQTYRAVLSRFSHE